MDFETKCSDCGAVVVVEIDGEDYPASLYDPGDSISATLIRRECDTAGIEENDFDPMCETNDHEVEENAVESFRRDNPPVRSRYRRF